MHLLIVVAAFALAAAAPMMSASQADEFDLQDSEARDDGGEEGVSSPDEADQVRRGD